MTFHKNNYTDIIIIIIYIIENNNNNNSYIFYLKKRILFCLIAVICLNQDGWRAKNQGYAKKHSNITYKNEENGKKQFLRHNNNNNYHDHQH